MKVNNWFHLRGTCLAVSTGIAAILFSVFGSTAHAQTWNGAGGDDNWFTGGNWVGGSAPTGTSDDAVVGAPAPVNLNGNVDLNSLTIDANGIVNINDNREINFGGTATTTLNNAGAINAGNNTDLQFQNTVINSGIISLNAGASNTDVEVDSTATLSGGGTITLNGVNAGVTGSSGAALTIVDQTIQGQGSVGRNLIQIDNQGSGLIDANVSGQLLTFDVNASGATNSGTIQASGGGILRVLNSEIDNTSGQILAQDGSEVRLFGSTITNGNLGTAGSGQLTVEESTSVRFVNSAILGSMMSLNNSDTELDGTIVSTGTMQIVAGAANTDIEVQAGGATLNGGGTVQLMGTNAGINGVSGSTLTIGLHTVEGEGSIGENLIGITNSATGVVDANVNGGTLTVDASALGFDNDGAMKASNQGTLRIQGTNLDNTGGSITAEADSTVVMAGSTVTGGTVTSVGTGATEIEGGSTVAFDGVTNNGTIETFNNSDFQLFNTFTNNGTVNINAVAANTDIVVQAGGTTLTGGGTVTLKGTNAGVTGVTGNLLTIADQTIEGEGSLGENLIGVVNSANGLVDANVSGQVLTVDTNDSVDFVNNGTLRASGGGIMRFNGTQMTNNNVIEALDGSIVESVSSTFEGGTLSTTGSGVFDVAAGTTTLLDDLTIDGRVRTFNNSDTQISGIISNEGSIDVTAGSSNTDILVQTGGATLTGGGIVNLIGTNAGINGTTGNTLTIGDQTIQGEGTLGENLIGVVNSANGLVDANVAGQVLTVDTNDTADFTNNGTLRASGGGIMRFNSMQMNNNNLIEALDGSKVESVNATFNGGTLSTAGSGVFEVAAGTTTRLDSLTIDGHLRSLNNSDTEVTGTIDNQGLMEIVAGAANTDIEVQATGATLTGGGTVRLVGTNAGINGSSGAVLDIASQIVIGQGSIGENLIDVQIGAGGTIEADVAASTLFIDTVGTNSTTFLTNDGTLRASNGATLDSAQGVINNGTINTRVGSTFEALTLDNTVGSILSGDGFVNVDNGDIDIAGVVAPGNSAGTLTLQDNAVFAATAELQTELESASLFDVLDVQGDLTLDGSLSVDLLGGFNPLISDTFLIATATGGVFGEFANVSDGDMLLTTGGEGSFTVNYLSNGVQLSNFTLTVIPEPSAAMCLIGIGLSVMVRRRR